MKPLALTMLLCCAAATRADLAYQLQTETPLGVLATRDGSLWFAARDSCGRIRPDGTIERFQPPFPFALEKTTSMAEMSDGTVLIASHNDVVARVDAQLHSTLIQLPERYGLPQLLRAPDDTIAFAHGEFFGRIDLDGEPRYTAFPFVITAIAAADDGTFFLASQKGSLHRLPRDGALETLDGCAQCGIANWLEVTRDGTVWFPNGWWSPRDGDHFARFDGVDAAIGPDGRVWIAGPDNAVRAIDANGATQIIPLATNRDLPMSIASDGHALWFGVRGTLRRLDPATRVDTRFRRGDVIAVEQEQNCCFEGVHPVLAFHRPGAQPFLRRSREADDHDWFYPRDVYALDADHIFFDALDERPQLLDGEGRTSRAFGPTYGEHDPMGVVVDREGTIFTLRRSNGYDIDVLAIDADGVMRRSFAFSTAPELVELESVDLAADQCTLFYATSSRSTDGFSTIGRVDVCRGVALAPFVGRVERASISGLRILRNGDVLVTSIGKLLRFDSHGTLVQQFGVEQPGYFDFYSSLALDADTPTVWVGTASELRRIDLTTGAVVERVSAYGFASRITVVGEPRAARVAAARRRAIVH